MNKIVTLSLILIIGLVFSYQYQGITKILTPEFNTADLSIPKSINFQGYLYRDGTPMDTTMNMWFGIYTALSGGSLLFQQTINNVEVVNGWFTVSLDNIPNSVFPISGPTRYLEVKAPSTGPALEPRFSLVSVGYSYHAITSDTAEYAKEVPVGSHSHTLTHTGQVTGSGSVNGSWALTITNGAVTNAKLGSNAVTSAKILDGTIKGVDISLPCSLQGSVALPGAILNIRNNGNGRGIIIDRVGGHGIYIDSTPSGSGLYINKPRDYGIQVDSSGNSGIYVKKSGLNGIQVGKAASYGLLVNSALNGVYVDEAGIYGVRVMKANNGFRVDTATTHGVRVLRANEDGVHIWDAGRDGVRVWRSDDNGIYVDSASDCGFFVNRADTGLKVYRAKTGIYVDSAGTGLRIKRASTGVRIDSAFDNGVYIYKVNGSGVEVVNASNEGLKVYNAWYGVYAYGDYTGGIFIAGEPSGVGLIANSYGGSSSDTAIRAHGKGVATGGWSTEFDKGEEAPCIVSSDRTIVAYGTTELIDGKTQIRYPEIFSKNIRNDIPVSITLTPKEEPSGFLYAKETDAKGFQVGLKNISGWEEKDNLKFSWIAIGTLKEPETSAEAKADWEKMMKEREARIAEKEKIYQDREKY